MKWANIKSSLPFLDLTWTLTLSVYSYGSFYWCNPNTICNQNTIPLFAEIKDSITILEARYPPLCPPGWIWAPDGRVHFTVSGAWFWYSLIEIVTVLTPCDFFGPFVVQFTLPEAIKPEKTTTESLFTNMFHDWALYIRKGVILTFIGHAQYRSITSMLLWWKAWYHCLPTTWVNVKVEKHHILRHVSIEYLYCSCHCV